MKLVLVEVGWYALQAAGNLSSPSGQSQLDRPLGMLNGTPKENGFLAKLTKGMTAHYLDHKM